MASRQTSILVVEDDGEIREGIRILLSSEGYAILEAPDGSTALKLFTSDIDLVVLDVMMPGMSGLRVCEEIRKHSSVPILFLTAKTQEQDKLIGLSAGGDDYLTKPFSYVELIARVKALLRRYHVYGGRGEEAQQSDDYIMLSKVRIAKSFNEVLVKGREVSLTETEYRILLLLMSNPSRIYSAQNIYEAVWEEPFTYTSGSTVMVHIRRLRTKIEEDPRNPKLIRTLWGKGYRFQADEAHG